MATFVQDAFGIVDANSVDTIMGRDAKLINLFFEPLGPRCVFFVYQPAVKQGLNGQLAAEGPKQLTIGTVLPPLVDPAAKAVYFIRNTLRKEGVDAKTVEVDISAGEVNQNALECFQTTLQEVYAPVLEQMQHPRMWGQAKQAKVTDLVSGVKKFGPSRPMQLGQLRWPGGVAGRV